MYDGMSSFTQFRWPVLLSVAGAWNSIWSWLYSLRPTCSPLQPQRRMSLYTKPLHNKLIFPFQENILVSPEGSPLIAGFGLSVSSRSASLAASPSHGMKGNLRWMAKELVEFSRSEHQDHTTQTDMWAFGMVILVSVYIVRFHRKLIAHFPRNYFPGRFLTVRSLTLESVGLSWVESCLRNLICSGWTMTESVNFCGKSLVNVGIMILQNGLPPSR